jgi:DNA-binding GntR family transcriptional regulator
MAQPMRSLQALIEDTRPKYRTITEMVSATLRQAIIEGTLASGEAIRQDQVAAAFGVSRMPVREALRQLEAEGLVEFYPHRGTVVAAIEPGDILEIFEIRTLLECHAMSKAASRIDPPSLDRAAEILDEIDNEPDIAKWGELNRRFHLSLYGGLKGGRLYTMVEAQYRHLDRLVRLVLSQLDYAERSQAEHRALLQHCRDGNADAAVKTLRDHLTISSSQLAKLLDAAAQQDG